MVEVKIYYRLPDGNRGKLKSTHRYKNAKEAALAKSAFIRIFRGRSIVAPIDSEIVKLRKERCKAETVTSSKYWCEFTPVDKDKPLMHMNMPKVDPKDAANKEICKNLLLPLYHWKHETKETTKKPTIPEYNVVHNERYIVL